MSQFPPGAAGAHYVSAFWSIAATAAIEPPVCVGLFFVVVVVALLVATIPGGARGWVDARPLLLFWQAACDPDCIGGWLAWGDCSVSCGGGGTAARVFDVVVNASDGGAACVAADNALERVECAAAQLCPGDCVGAWLAWGDCSTSCGNGTVIRTFRVSVSASGGATECEAADGAVLVAACPSIGNTTSRTACPQDCVGAWSDWTVCDATCGLGTRSRSFNVSVAAADGGVACVRANSTEETVNCVGHGCPVDCVGSWLAWGECSVSCGANRTATRVFRTTVNASDGGVRCTADDGAVQLETCATSPCPQDCMGTWSLWTTCDALCGAGHKSRTYSVSVAAEHGGLLCDDENSTIESLVCSAKEPCRVDCVGAWLAWGECSTTCGANGTLTRTFEVAEHASGGGAACVAEDGAVRSAACEDADAAPCNNTGLWDVPATTTESDNMAAGAVFATLAVGVIVIIVVVVAVPVLWLRKKYTAGTSRARTGGGGDGGWSAEEDGGVALLEVASSDSNLAATSVEARRHVLREMSTLLNDIHANDASVSRWATAQELAALLQRLQAYCATGCGSEDSAEKNNGADRADEHDGARGGGVGEAAEREAVAAAAALLRSSLAEQRVLLYEAVERTNLGQMAFYGERVEFLRQVLGEAADGSAQHHLADSPMECVSPGLLLRKVLLLVVIPL
jgi:hypothetical protein